MKNQISVSELLACTGIVEEDIRDRAESDGIELSEAQVREIAEALRADQDLFAARQEALSRALSQRIGKSRKNKTKKANGSDE